ncbi:hypothetical protein BTVI_02195 [Pitangus sulphuratus]|nr:hypothetical protein BTVI_02195 [Pitangus sulphuratus]
MVSALFVLVLLFNPAEYIWFPKKLMVYKSSALLPCTNPMWKKVIKGAPAPYVNCLISVFHPKADEPDVETMCQWIQSIAENLEDPSDVQYQPIHSKEKMERDYEYSSYEDAYEDRGDSDSRDYRDRPVKWSRP